jgi:8-oxo-dGTP diphosphatase
VLPGDAGRGHYLILSFAARWIAKEPVLNEELDDFKWLSPGVFGDLKLTGGLTGVIEAARRLIRSSD